MSIIILKRKNSWNIVSTDKPSVLPKAVIKMPTREISQLIRNKIVFIYLPELALHSHTSQT